ncbi:MAG: HU family DNA-binding protein [Acidimicrobiia bacterium]
MNRKELVTAIAEDLDADKRSTDAFLSAFIDVVTTTVSNGEPITITGFAKFARRDVAAKPKRQVRNPATGETMWAKPKPASKAVKITPLKAFKDAVLASKRGGVKKLVRRR